MPEQAQARLPWRLIVCLVFVAYLVTAGLLGYRTSASRDVEIEREIFKKDSVNAAASVAKSMIEWERERTERKRYAWVQESLTVLVRERNRKPVRLR